MPPSLIADGVLSAVGIRGSSPRRCIAQHLTKTDDMDADNSRALGAAVADMLLRTSRWSGVGPGIYVTPSGLCLCGATESGGHHGPLQATKAPS